MTILDDLPPARRKSVEEAAAGCWEGTDELIAHVVKESLHKGAWRPARASLMAALADPGDQHMSAAQFGLWKKQARRLANLQKRTEKPEEDMGIPLNRFYEMSSPSRRASKGVYTSRAEAMACAHYLLGYPKPCTPEGLREWFNPRFGAMPGVLDAIGLESTAFAARLNGYWIDDGVKKIVVAEGYFIRALDWIWRFGPVNPYGAPPALAFWPGQDLIER